MDWRLPYRNKIVFHHILNRPLLIQASVYSGSDSPGSQVCLIGLNLGFLLANSYVEPLSHSPSSFPVSFSQRCMWCHIVLGTVLYCSFNMGQLRREHVGVSAYGNITWAFRRDDCIRTETMCQQPFVLCLWLMKELYCSSSRIMNLIQEKAPKVHGDCSKFFAFCWKIFFKKMDKCHTKYIGYFVNLSMVGQYFYLDRLVPIITVLFSQHKHLIARLVLLCFSWVFRLCGEKENLKMVASWVVSLV